MSWKRRRDAYRGRYVNRAEQAQQAAARDAEFRVALQTSLVPKATSEPCMSDLGAYGRVCPLPEGCAAARLCALWVQRQQVILKARLATLLARWSP